MPRTFVRASLATFALVILPAIAFAQVTPTPPATPASGTVTTPSTTLEFSGVLYPQFVYGGAKGARSQNRFDVERAYLNVRAKVADRTSIRLTSDIYRPAANASYTVRAKYAYLQYDYWMNGEGYMGTTAQTRLGMQQTVVIDQEEQYWPRYLTQVAIERAGFFSSSDIGASTTIGFRGGRAEVFGMVANGSGYAQGENDRFKDYSFRLSLTPWGAPNAQHALVVSPWVYKGARQSAIDPGAGLKKDRLGVFAAWRSPSVTVGGDYAVATNENEAGTLVNRTTQDQSGTVISLFTQIKPFTVMSGAGNPAWGVILRYDNIDSDNAFVPSGGAFPVAKGTFIVAGITHDVNNRLSWAIDWQQQSPNGVAAAALDVRTYNLHTMVSF
jgi:hypothetical protein